MLHAARSGAKTKMKSARGKQLEAVGVKQRVLLVDDHPVVCEGLAQRINAEQDLEVCGQARDAHAALAAIEKLRPNIAVVDIGLGEGNGIELIKDVKVRYPQLPTLVLSMHDELQYAERALRAGARGYIMKREAARKIVEGIRRVLAGQLYISEAVAAVMVEKFVDGRPAAGTAPVQQLSNRELEVFQLLGSGHNTRQIADHLHVGFKTVQAYNARIKEKLKLTNATELLREAIRWHESRQPK